LTLVLTFRPAWFFSVDQLAMAANCVIAAMGCLVILSLLDGGSAFAISNLLLIYMYIFGFIRLLFSTAVACGIMIVCIYNLFIIYGDMDYSSLTPNNYLLLCGLLIGATTTRLLEGSARRHFLTRRALQAEKKRTDDLILSIFPPEIAKRLHAGEKVIADSHGEGTVLFADLVGFTDLARRFSPTHVVEVLNDLFSMMDRLAAKHGIEKIKTIGDAYMAASGVTTWAPDSAERIAEFALELVEQLGDYAKQHNYPIAVRVGIATGQVVSGVIGSTKPSFDLWGDTVNLASRLEQQSDAGSIQVSEATYWRLQEKFQFEKRGLVVAKGIGEVEAFLLRGRKPPLRLIEKGTGATAR
jgi:adenylate cyclase